MPDQIGVPSGLLSPWVDRLRMKNMARFIPPESRVLDVGCGAGLLIPHLPKDCSYVGIDCDRALVEQDKKIHPDQFFREIEASSSVFPFNNEAFDAVVMAAVLEFVPNPRILLSEVARVLKLSGTAVAATTTRTAARLHTGLSALGLLCGDARRSQRVFWTRADMKSVLKGTGLNLVQYRRFEFGLNQIFVFKKDA